MLVQGRGKEKECVVEDIRNKSSQEQGRGSKKEQASLDPLMKRQAHCCPSSAATKGKLEVMKVFQKLQKDLGMGVALESSQKVLAAIETDMFHDAVGCPDFQVCGNWEFCKRSHYHPQHDLHVCPESQVCFCLNPKYSYDHFN